MSTRVGSCLALELDHQLLEAAPPPPADLPVALTAMAEPVKSNETLGRRV